MHFAFYLADSGRIGLNLHFKCYVKSGYKICKQALHFVGRHAGANCLLEILGRAMVHVLVF